MTRFAFLMLLVVHAARAQEPVSLFNGRDLTGWTNVNCAPETWSVRDGVIHCTGQPIGALRTLRQYENFVLELDWRHLQSGGNSGIFIWSSPIAAPGVPFLRAIEVQVLDNGYNAQGKGQWYTTHGDVFPIHGSTMKPFGRHNGMRSFPSEDLSKSSPEWNHYRIDCNNGVIRLSVNGKEVSGGEDCVYRKGYIGLESEGAPVEFRNIRLLQLPSTRATPEQSAPVDQRWRSLFTGLDFRGWKTNAATAAQWRVESEQLVHTGAGSSEAGLWTEQAFANAEFVIDCRLGKEQGVTAAATPKLALMKGDKNPIELTLTGAETGVFRRFVVTVKAGEATVRENEKVVGRVTLQPEQGGSFRLGIQAIEGPVRFMNLYVREL